jgi:uncharacterized membrane protein YeaQ/YmgE (transglycosylase-associated protein family)
VLTYLVVTAIFGLLIGALGRLSLPGPDPMGLLATMAIGVIATWAAGLVVYAFLGSRYAVTIPVAAAFSTFIVYLVRKSRGGGLEDPGVDRRTGRPSRRHR